MEKKTLHLICNAHLDPVWLWNLDEGISAALSTYHTAADFCDRYEGFVFNHNEVLLYRWIEEYDPKLFEKIKVLVAEGKWNIMGGWFLQPDCNMPSGESFIRQARTGRNYFKETFGVEPHTAINFDSFGHSRGLVQILKKAGYHSYLFCRPSQNDFAIESDDFIWEGFDGSTIIGHRASEGYGSLMGDAGRRIEERLDALHQASKIAEEDTKEKRNANEADILRGVGETHTDADKDRTNAILLWGVGNHGGGPSRKDMADIGEIQKKEKEWEIVHSIPENYFETMDEAKLKTVSRDINPWAVGCYTSQIQIKQGHRRLEGGLGMAEKMAAQAAMQSVMSYPHKEIKDAEYSLMLSEFHDILPGTSIRPVEKQALGFLGHGTEIADRIRRRAFFTMLSGQDKAADGEYPILAYNPHPWPIKGIFTCEFQLKNQNWTDTYAKPVLYKDGKKIPCQIEKEECNMNLDWRKKVVFETELAASSMTRISAYIEWVEKPVQNHKLEGDSVCFEGDKLSVKISRKSGLMTSLIVNGREYIKGEAGRLKVLKSDKDPWGMNRKSYEETMGYFELLSPQEGSEFSGSPKTIDSVRIIEDGEIRTVVECVFGYKRSRAALRYSLPKHGTAIELDCQLEWLEKGAFLKLEIPTVLTEAKALGETAFGVQEYKIDGLEKVGHRWNGLFDFEKDLAFTVINDGTYGLSFREGVIENSMLHSAAYAAHPIGDRQLIRDDRYLNYIDQGERSFHYVIEAGSAHRLRETITKAALIVQESPMIVNAFPSGLGKKMEKTVEISDETVVLTSLRETEEGFVLRLFESTGKEREVEISLLVLGIKETVKLNAYEAKSLLVDKKSNTLVECSILL